MALFGEICMIYVRKYGYRTLDANWEGCSPDGEDSKYVMGTWLDGTSLYG